MFRQKAAVFHRNENGSWQVQSLSKVYIGTEKEVVVQGNEKHYVESNVLIVPGGVDISQGDIVYPGSRFREMLPAVNDSGNSIIKNGGWRVKTVANNVYLGCTVNHTYVSDA